MAAHSQKIGPYTLEKRLGAGGMGEVYQAYDQRLDRRVAVKLIRPEHTESPTARERLRREARAAAGLSHPSIVQVHDIVETDDSDAIVMELIEGEPLSARITRGPLSVDEAVRIGHEIAEGLAAAHAKGLIHRDLKPENVMITTAGKAKILDFGLAKRLEGEASLTQDQRVLGTFRSMSPEQAQGLPLDARSDLFSFGLLLYEMLSGKSPFEGISTLETLTRICTHRQAPLRGGDRAIPAPLSDLVDQLLEKEPALRPWNAREVGKALEALAGRTATDFDESQETQIENSVLPPAPTFAASARAPGPYADRAVIGSWRWILLVCVPLLLTATLIWRFWPRTPPRSLSIAVPKTVIDSNDGGERTELLAASLRSALLQSLIRYDGLRLLGQDQVDRFDGPSTALARALAADEIVTSRLSCHGEICSVSLSRIFSDGRLLWTQSFDTPLDRPYLALEAVQSYLRQGYPALTLRSGFSKLNVREEDYTRYLRLLRAFRAPGEERPPIDNLVESAREIRRGSPGFLEAYVFEAQLLQTRFYDRRDATDLERANKLLRQARELSPRDPRPVLTTFDIDLAAERLDAAAADLQELDRLQPGDPGGLAGRARLLERRGRSREAVGLLQKAAAIQPSYLYRLAGL